MSNLIEKAVSEFVQKNHCEYLKDKLFELVTCDDVVDAIMVKQNKMMFNWRFKSELSDINNNRENAGLQRIKPRPIDLDLIEDEFNFLQQTSTNWQKDMRKAISKVMGIAKSNGTRYERIQ